MSCYLLIESICTFANLLIFTFANFHLSLISAEKNINHENDPFNYYFSDINIQSSRAGNKENEDCCASVVYTSE